MKKKILLSLFVCLFLLLTACEEKEYQVTFLNDEEIIEKIAIKNGSLINEYKVPVKEGYTFIGYTNENKIWNFNQDIVTCDLSLRALYDNNYIFSMDKKTIIGLTDIGWMQEALTIPDCVEVIKSKSFINCEMLKKLTISNSVFKIEEKAFINCNNLEIEKKDNISYLDNWIISVDDKSLEAYTLKDDTRGFIDSAFNGCYFVKNINIPNKVKVLSDNLFYDCESLENITMHDNIITIGNRVFFGCVSLKEINIPKSVNNLGNSTFSYCESLEKIELPESIRYINEGLFYKCKMLKEITIPQNVLSIGRNAFSECLLLENIILPNTILEIEEGAFLGCRALKTIKISDNLVYIGNIAFFGCESLEKIIIPESTTVIGYNAFNNNPLLTIYASASSEKSDWQENWKNKDYQVVWDYKGE